MQQLDTILFLSDSHGQYIPKCFAEQIRKECLSGVKPDTLEILLAGPDHEWYWEAWTDVTDNGIVMDDDGNKFSVYQDGDCWLIPEGMEWSDDEGFFVWASDDESECEHDGQPDEAQEWHDFDKDC